MDKEFNILDTWFGRTVICSMIELEYEQAQGILNKDSKIPGLGNSIMTMFCLRSHVYTAYRLFYNTKDKKASLYSC
jgi:exoribonuclease R